MLNELYDLMKRYERKGSFTYAEVNDDILNEAEKY